MIQKATGGKHIADITQESSGLFDGTNAGQKLPNIGIQSSYGLLQATINQDNAFSYQSPLITPNGIFEKLSEGDITFYEGQKLETSLPMDPISESLGSMKCYVVGGDGKGKLPEIARLTKDNGVYRAGLDGGSAPLRLDKPLQGDIYRTPSTYHEHGLKKISFSNTHTNLAAGGETYFSGLLGTSKKQYVFLWGNVDETVGEKESNYAIQFAKLKLVFLSLMMSTKQKKEGFMYKYPLFDPAKPNANNNKVLKTKYNASSFDFDNLIDANNEFLESIGGYGNTGYQRELYAIAYQLMVGQAESELGSSALLAEGIEKKTYFHVSHATHLPVSEEVSPILSDLGEIGKNTLIADIKPVYNYTIPYYEQAAPQIPEIRLPNIYRSLMIDGIDNFGELYMSVENKKYVNYNQNPESDDNYSYNDSLYENIANSFIICGETEKSVYENPKYTSMMNIILDPDFFHNNPIHGQAESLKSQLPMYVEVSFGTEDRLVKFDKFVKTLADYNIIKHYIQTYIKHGGPKTNAASIVDEKTNGTTAYVNVLLEEIKNTFNFLDTYGLYHPLTHQVITRFKDNPELALYDPNAKRTLLPDSLTTNFGRWFQIYAKAGDMVGMLPFGVYNPENNAFITMLFDPLNINGEGQHAQDPLAYALYSKTVYGWGGDLDSANSVASYSLPVVQPEIQQMFEDETIGYSSINSGNTAKSVTLFYEIKKYAGSENIQNIFVQNKYGKQKIRYIDTQVKYGVNYRYRIIAHKLVFSSEYKIRFENTDVTDKMATQLGYGKKQTLDILYSAILDQNNNKVGDYFNSPIFNPFSGPLYTSLKTGPSTSAIANLINDASEQEDQIPYEGASIFDSFFDVSGVEEGQAPGQSGQIYAIGDPNSGLFGSNAIVTNFSTYRAYTQTDAYPSKDDTLFDRNGNDINNTGNNSTPDSRQDTGGECVVPFPEDPASSGLVGGNTSEKLFIFEVNTFPNPVVSKIPYYEEADVVVMDDPPIYPNVTFCPFAKEKRKLMITFENQGGMMNEVPINLMPKDLSIFNAIRNCQKKGYTLNDGSLIDDTIRFKNDDFAAEYQVFRIIDEPSSYDDFFGKLYKTLNVSVETAYNEILQTNTKYYYTFRTIDKHDKISNPTPVYQVEMVEDGGLVYPVINVFDMSAKNKLNKSKPFDRFLKIEAAHAQKILNLEESNIELSGEFKDNFKPSLGILDESIWNQKKFKFRIKAKNSCRAIDLNINFVTKHTDTDKGPKTCN